MSETNRLMTITELARHERLKGFTQRQIEYAIQQHGIEPTDRLGIIRAFGVDQIEQIAAALQAIQDSLVSKSSKHRITCQQDRRGPVMKKPAFASPAGVSAQTAKSLAVDATRIVAEIFPDLSLRAWRAYDSAGKCPRSHELGGRKLWRISDLEL